MPTEMISPRNYVLFDVEFTLLSIDVEVDLEEPEQDLACMHNMLSLRAGEGQNVIQVNKHIPIDHVAQDIIHPVLEDNRGLVNPKGITRYSKCPEGLLKPSSSHPQPRFGPSGKLF